MRQKILLVTALLSIMICGLYLLIPKNSKLQLETSNPPNNATNTKTSSPIVLQFTQPLDADSPYKTVEISPRTEISIEVDGSRITIKPKNQFRQETKYTVTFNGLLAANGSSIESLAQVFTTGQRSLTAFEKSLPYSGDGFTIEQLGDASIVVLINSDEVEKSKAAARAYLQKNGIDPDTISFGTTSTATDY